MVFSIKSRFVDKMAAYYDEAPLDPAAGIFASAGRIGPDSPSYYVFDINMRFDELFMNNTFINLHITNLLNNQVRYPAFVNNTWMDRGSVGEIRNIVLTAGYNL